MTAPTADAFAALARSSPWRWSTLRFTVRWPADPWRTQELRAWVRRPDLLRVETAQGALVQVVRERRRQVGVLGSGGGHTRTLPWGTAPSAPGPLLRGDGLVAERPDRFGREFSYDAPMYRDYSWVAMLDPVELADGRDPESSAVVPGLAVDGVTEVEHGGRPAWEALARPTEAYEPRCSCCSLLRSRAVDVALRDSGGGDVVLGAYPEAYRIRLDLGTGVCVFTRPLGGDAPGAGLDVRIEAVDEPMPDALFAATG